MHPELRTLVFAPSGQDGKLTRDFLVHAGHPAENCRDITELCARFEEGCGAVVLAEEALALTRTSGLVESLTRQPPWSDVPIVIVTSDGRLGEERARRLGIFGPAANVTLLERPFRPITLVSAVDTALRARRRQYEVRALLHELRTARDTAERANLAKDDFLAALSHELRTPLNPVLLLASEAAQDPQTPSDYRGDFAMIARNVELEARLIDDLLDLTRITRGKLALDRQRLDLHATLHDALAAIEADLQGRSLNLRLELQARHPAVFADRVRLQQVLWNVLKNAVKFTPENGVIKIRTRNLDGDGRIALEVMDTGIGMTPNEIAAAFDAFAQGEHAGRTSPRRFGGLGLGLAISRMLVEMHGGTIRASSQGRDHGSTFTIEFPVFDPAAARLLQPGARAAATAPPGGSGAPATRSVLLVEDHAPTRVSLSRLLHRRGFTVTAAESIAEATAAVRARSYDLLISDLGLPDGDGCELATRLRERFGHCIALSGYGMEADIARTRAAGFTTHLVKPLTIQSLDHVLGRLAKTLPRK